MAKPNCGCQFREVQLSRHAPPLAAGFYLRVHRTVPRTSTIRQGFREVRAVVLCHCTVEALESLQFRTVSQPASKPSSSDVHGTLSVPCPEAYCAADSSGLARVSKRRHVCRGNLHCKRLRGQIREDQDASVSIGLLDHSGVGRGIVISARFRCLVWQTSQRQAQRCMLSARNPQCLAFHINIEYALLNVSGRSECDTSAPLDLSS